MLGPLIKLDPEGIIKEMGALFARRAPSPSPVDQVHLKLRLTLKARTAADSTESNTDLFVKDQ